MLAFSDMSASKRSSSLRALALLSLGAGSAFAKSTLFTGGTIIAFDNATESLQVIRGGSLLVTDDRIAAVNVASTPTKVSRDTETVDVTGKILTPGFIDTHRHGWQTGLKTIASNTTLVEYFMRYSEYAAGSIYTAEDVYIGQLAGLYEALNAGVTTSLDHAHHTWSDETAEAGLQGSIDSGARVFWSYAFHNVPTVNVTVDAQIAHFRTLAQKKPHNGSPTELCIAYDSWGPAADPEEAKRVASLVKYVALRRSSTPITSPPTKTGLTS
jgi:cytosine/adenosine deaminase-related metal-dependent hydrolase